MRITVLTVGSRGDVQPYIALAIGLKQAGHSVCLAAHRYFEEFVTSFGLEFMPVAGDPRMLIEGETGLNWLDAGPNPIPFARKMIDLVRPVMWQILDDFCAACHSVDGQRADLIVHPILASLAATSISEKLNIPTCAAYLQHVHPTSEYPFGLLRPLTTAPLWIKKSYNRASHDVAGQIFWRFARPLINQWRVNNLELDPLPWRSEFAAWLRRHEPCLYGFSPVVVPPARAWGKEVHVTGYWFLPDHNQPAAAASTAAQSEHWSPPNELVTFLAQGPPPVYIGFGSMSTRNPAAVTEIALQSLKNSGQRGIILTGWGGLSNADLPDSVLKIESVPHQWLFPRMAAVVHHGGIGTTAAGLAAGVPSIIVPFFADQPFWGSRVAALGVGPQPVSRNKLTVDRLTAAIVEATENEDMQLRAAKLGEQIQNEDGVANAVRAIEENFSCTIK